MKARQRAFMGAYNQSANEIGSGYIEFIVPQY